MDANTISKMRVEDALRVLRVPEKEHDFYREVAQRKRETFDLMLAQHDDRSRSLPVAQRTADMLHVRSIDLAARTIEVVASTPRIDSHGEIVEQVWDLSRYTKNPVVLYGHDQSELPIGVCEQIAVIANELRARIRFATAKASPKAEQVWQGVQEQTIRAVSVGFKPRTIRAEMRDGKEILVLSDNELYELSMVAVGSNPDALVKAAGQRGASPDATHKRPEPARNTAVPDVSDIEVELERLAQRSVGGPTVEELRAELREQLDRDEHRAKERAAQVAAVHDLSDIEAELERRANPSPNHNHEDPILAEINRSIG